jgi:hypothetical protein
VNYNLLEEEWIPVLWRDGTVTRVGIRTALTQASRIRQIAATNPMDRLAVVRFLLALLYWCKGNPSDESSTLSRGAFPAAWFSKLDENRDRFNLLSDARRFYQYRASGARKDEKLSANYLAQEIPTGTNLWHFRHSTDGVDGLCPACCATGLLRLPLFATSGGRGKPPGVNAKPPIYVVPVGATLGETLRLSWRRAGALGTPAWEKPSAALPARGKVSLLMGLTWLPRRVWLDDPTEPKAPCGLCGRTEPLIRLTVFAPIGSTRTEQGSSGRIWRDPHVIYEATSKGDLSLHAGNALGMSDAAAGQWARIASGTLNAPPQAISDRSAQETGTGLWVVGFATVQNDKYLEAMEWLLPLRVPSAPAEAAATFDRWQKEGSGIVRRVARAFRDASSRKHVEVPPAFAAVRPDVEARVSAQAGELIEGPDEAWTRAAAGYHPMMEAIARSLSPGFTVAAVERRSGIGKVAPDVTPRSEAAQRSGRKKGGDK